MITENTEKREKGLILLVEDEINIARLFSYNIKKAGYTCYTASNGAEGMGMVESLNPDLIISDIMMPEVDGFQFRKNLMKNPELKDIPFVFLTAKGEENDIMHGYGLDIEDYILKTASPKVVLAKVGAILKSHQKQRDKIIDEVHKAADNLGTRVVADHFPEFDGFDVKHWHVPYQNVPGGDFIDYFQLNDDNLVIVLGDVMGKKWGAWYFAVAYAGYVRSAIRFIIQSGEKLSPSNIISKVNEAVYYDERLAEVFITLSIITLDKKNMTAKYGGAGDLPLIYKNSTIKAVRSTGTLLGFSPEAIYKDFNISLNSGDSLYLVTDGITESRNSAGEFYGEKRLYREIHRLKQSADSIENVKNSFINFTSNNFEDDISLIAVKTL